MCGVVGITGVTPHGVVVMVAVVMLCGIVVTVVALCGAAATITVVTGIVVGGWAVVGLGGKGRYVSVGKEGGERLQ